MKKNYLEPKVKVQTIALQSMIAVSEIHISDDEPTHGPDAKEHLLDGLFD